MILQTLWRLKISRNDDNAKLFESAMSCRKRRRTSIDSDYGTREDEQPAHSLLDLIKPTYYSPPDSNRFYSVFNISSTNETGNSPPLFTIAEEENAAEADENGWALTNDGKWFHREANITVDTNPYEYENE